ncbi:glutamine synthetase family protein [Treponema pectinovorum]|uniref:glutamine synthetase family protein n=1 Tax=Treponema pectinovorum TaxID=164 RepID=UPI0011F28010|nr:glutamine synthetase family protein [Treponema pectinovorum]
MYSKSEVIDYINEEDVKFIRLAYIDFSGKQKNVSILAGELERAFSEGISFDASAIEGFQDSATSDLFLHPDPSTLSLIPWRPTSGKVVRMFCDIKYPDGKPYEKDCRYLLKQAVKKAKEEYSLEFKFGTEFEFYLFRFNEASYPSVPFDDAGYMDISPDDKGENIRREINFTLEQMGITPELSHHEAGPGQNEIDFRSSNAQTAADNASTFKWVVRTKAESNGLYADFSPKPLPKKPGNGLHINISVNRAEKMPQILAGILEHLSELTYFLNSSDNSYARIKSPTVPKIISWGVQNRSCVIRVPSKNQNERIQLRSPDSTCNIYLAFTLLIYAALDGIENNYPLPEPVKENLFQSKNESDEAFIKRTAKFKTIPQSLDQAKDIAEKSEFIRRYIKF